MIGWPEAVGGAGGRNGIAVACMLLACLTSAGATEAPSFAEAVNKAGRQRMLTQRIARLYCQIGLEIEVEQSRTELRQAVALFESQLGDLARFEGETETREALDAVRRLWTPYKALVTSTPARASARALVDMDEALLQASDRVVRILENRSGVSTSRLVNIAGRQRMLSQRLAKFHMLRAWGEGTPADVSEMHRARNEFQGGLQVLGEATDNTSLIREKLVEAERQWMWLRGSLDFTDGADFPRIVADASDKMLRIMESLTGLYQQVAER